MCGLGSRVLDGADRIHKIHEMNVVSVTGEMLDNLECNNVGSSSEACRCHFYTLIWVCTFHMSRFPLPQFLTNFECHVVKQVQIKLSLLSILFHSIQGLFTKYSVSNI